MTELDELEKCLQEIRDAKFYATHDHVEFLDEALRKLREVRREVHNLTASLADARAQRDAALSTRRDEHARAAMQVRLTAVSLSDRLSYRAVAHDAYRMADVMEEVRAASLP